MYVQVDGKMDAARTLGHPFTAGCPFGLLATKTFSRKLAVNGHEQSS